MVCSEKWGFLSLKDTPFTALIVDQALEHEIKKLNGTGFITSLQHSKRGVTGVIFAHSKTVHHTQ